MIKTIIPTSEFSLSKRRIICRILVDQWQRFDIENRILSNKKYLSDSNNTTKILKKLHTEERLLYGNRVYVILHCIDVNLPYIKVENFHTYEISVSEYKYIDILNEFIEFKKLIMSDLQQRVRRRKLTDDISTIDAINALRMEIRIIKKEVEVLEALKNKLIQYLK